MTQSKKRLSISIFYYPILKGEIINEAFATGDEIINEKVIEIPVGESYGYILSFAYQYRTSCSDFRGDLTKRYYEDTVIIIPSTNESLDVDDSIGEDQININTASKKELESLKGIGPSRSKKIIDYRRKKKIESFSELKELLGVSDGLIEEIKKQAIL